MVKKSKTYITSTLHPRITSGKITTSEITDVHNKVIAQIARYRATVKVETTSLAFVGVQKGKCGLIRIFVHVMQRIM